jgi:hypothetical protein
MSKVKITSEFDAERAGFEFTENFVHLLFEGLASESFEVCKDFIKQQVPDSQSRNKMLEQIANEQRLFNLIAYNLNVEIEKD